MPRSVITDQEVLDAAGRLFRRHGYAATGLRDVAAEAGVLLGSVQYRYRTKEELLVSLMRRGMTRALSSVGAACRASSDPLERLRLCMRTHLELLVTLDDATYVLLYEWRSLSRRHRPSVIALRDKYEALWQRVLHDALVAGRLDKRTDLRMVRLLILGSLNWIPQWYDPRQTKSIDEVADALWRTILWGAASRETRRP
jgi:AcrR family transcriptional regulator